MYKVSETNRLNNIYSKNYLEIISFLYIMRRKMSEDERKLHRHNTVVKYRQTEKGKLATRRAALKYYHKTKVLKTKPVQA